MTTLTEDVEVKVSTNAAQHFVDTYYAVLNDPKRRSEIASFYVTPTPSSPVQADISMNGNLVASPADLQAIFEKQVAKARYEVQSFDCQVLNPDYNIGADDSMLGPDKDGKKMSILVLISGSVKYGKEGAPEGETRGFSENIVLVPNWEAHSSKTSKGLKRWLILSQNFRLVL
ncbi:hypothetical protein F5884DRAFT_859258 [Xylogone sp. PMI_703]|nr:hypothetical protein F5884DRAFT_859258 [Xylogone sp. PMI_703]